MPEINSKVLAALYKMREIAPGFADVERVFRTDSAKGICMALTNQAFHSYQSPQSSIVVQTAMNGLLAVIEDTPLHSAGEDSNELFTALEHLKWLCTRNETLPSIDRALATRTCASLESFMRFNPGRAKVAYDCGEHPPGITCHGALIMEAYVSAQSLAARFATPFP